MKTIEEKLKFYLQLPIDKEHHLGFKLGFVKGVEFAQRWISVEKEFPEQSMPVEQIGHYKHTENVIYKTSNGKYGITCRTEFLDHGFVWNGSGTLQQSITHWRPIDIT